MQVHRQQVQVAQTESIRRLVRQHGRLIGGYLGHSKKLLNGIQRRIITTPPAFGM